MIRKLLRDEAGFLISAEFTVIFTLMFCGAAVGFAVIRDAMVGELHDVSEAIGAVNQTYNVVGIQKPRLEEGEFHGRAAGFGFNDRADTCDCDPIVFVPPIIKQDPSGIAGGGGGAPDGTQ